MKLFEDYKRLKCLPGFKGVLWWLMDQSFWVILVYRFLNYMSGTFMWPLAKVIEKVFEFIFKCYIPSGTTIGEGLVIYHAFNIIINGKSKIGKNCIIYSGVCLGNRWPGDGAPDVADNVVIGSGAKIFGPVKIPSFSIVPTNSVITPKNVNSIKVRVTNEL